MTRRGALAGLTGLGALAVGALMDADRAFAASRDELKFHGFQNVLDLPGVTEANRNDPAFPWQDVINTWTLANQGNPQATLYFPPRVYMIGGNGVKVRSNERLVGHGPLSILKAAADLSAIMVTTPNPPPVPTDVRIEDLTLDGNRPERAGSDKALLNVQGERIHVRRVTCVNAPHTGINGGIGTFGLTDSSICDCRIFECPKDGITVWAQDPEPTQSVFNVLLARNHIKDSRDDHLGLLLGAKWVAMVGNVIDYGPDKDADEEYVHVAQGSCIMVRRGASHVAIVGNVCRGGARAGIELSAGEALENSPVQDVTIANNVISEPGNVRSNVANTGIVSGNGIVVNAPAGRTVTGITVTGNVITAPRNRGIWIKCAQGSTVSDVVVTDNVIRYKRDADYYHDLLDGEGILCWDESADNPPTTAVSAVRIAGNTVVDTVRPGVEIRGRVESGTGRTVSGIDVTNNTVINPGPLGTEPQAGIVLDQVADLSVLGNRAVRTSVPDHHGVRLANVSGQVVVEGNSGANAAGTRSVDVGATTDIQRLRIRDNPGFNPWTGHVDVTLTGSPPTATVTNIEYSDPPVPFPAVKPPKVLLTVEGSVGAYAMARDVNAFKFDLQVVAPSATGPVDVRVNWLAEPFDP